jgi:hypothetical protein
MKPKPIVRFHSDLSLLAKVYRRRKYDDYRLLTETLSLKTDDLGLTDEGVCRISSHMDHVDYFGRSWSEKRAATPYAVSLLGQFNPSTD